MKTTLPDSIQRAIDRFRSASFRRNQECPEKLEALQFLLSRRDARVLPFLHALARNEKEYDLARIEALKNLGARPLRGAALSVSGFVVADVLRSSRDPDVRHHAAMIMHRFTRCAGAVSLMQQLILDPKTDLDLRHNLLFSLEASKDRPVIIPILVQLLHDPQFSKSAHRVLSDWGALPEGADAKPPNPSLQRTRFARR